MFRTPFRFQEILDLILTQPIVTIIILVVFLSIVVKTLLSRKWLSAIIDHLKGLALTVLLAGFVLYFYGYWMFFEVYL